uniref:Uncharacterized protein n=1 Tax=Oryza nivara TaxID=4536 RepID=A0A0E0JB28_ORYNI
MPEISVRLSGMREENASSLVRQPKKKAGKKRERRTQSKSQIDPKSVHQEHNLQMILPRCANASGNLQIDLLTISHESSLDSI